MTDEVTENVSGENTVEALTEVNPIELSEEQAPPEDEKTDDSEKQELLDKIASLDAELLRERIKIKLLVSGILPEKLEEGAAMAYGLCLAGKAPDDAANEIITAYPHFKAVRQEMPQFSTESRGSGDGFSAIRKIFSSR